MKKELKVYLTSLMILFVAISLITITLYFGFSEDLSGYFSLIDIAPDGFEYEPPVDLSSEAALLSLERVRGEINTIEEFNLSTTFMEDVYTEADQSYQAGDYENVFKTTQLIHFIKEEKITFLDQMQILEREVQQTKKEVDTTEPKSLVGEAMAAFQADQVDDANFLLEQAGVELKKAKSEHTRARELARLGKNFFLRYWWQIFLILIILGFSAKPVIKKINLKIVRTKRNRLKAELEKSTELIKRLQKSCFVDKKITAKAYKEKVTKYQERIAEIKHTLPVLEAELQGKKKKGKEIPVKKKVRGVLEVKR